MYSVCNTLKGWVSPFGNLRINACLLAPRSLSRATTSFIACNRQGIHHVHLFTCPYNVSLCLRSQTKSGYRGISMSLAFAVSKVFSHCMLAHALLRTLYILFDLIQSYPSTMLSHHGRIFTSSRLLKNKTANDLEKIKPKSKRFRVRLRFDFWWRLTGSNR